MRTLVAGFALTFFAGSMVAQSPAPAPAHTFTSAADVQALIAKANKERKPDQANFSQPLLTLAPYRANMEYRAVVGTPAVHTTEAEVFYVIDGAATLVTGGKLVDAKANAGGFAGSAIEGGETRQVAKGDFFIVPENTPHGFSAISQTLVLMTLHVPRPVPAAH
jgi:mannose-6-phosphate isomerase-like protein (cupin superfamily)